MPSPFETLKMPGPEGRGRKKHRMQDEMLPEQREAERRAYMQELIKGGKPKLTEEERKAHEETERLKLLQREAKKEKI